MNFIVGRQPIIEALHSETLIEKILIANGAHGEPIAAIRQLARTKNILCSDVPSEHLTKHSRANTQGVLAILGEKEYCEFEDILAIAQQRGEKPFILIFDEVEDPHNLGALIRTAFCTGAHGGIIPKHHSASVNDTVAKTSAGASAHFPIAKVTNIAHTIDELKELGVWIIGAEMNAEKSFIELDYTIPLALVIGNEGKGIRRLVKEKCDFLAKIPMKGSLDSLNVSVAGALMMYEVMRKRNFK